MTEGREGDSNRGLGERAYVGVGTNLGDREGTLGRVIALLSAEPGLELEMASSVYETAPVGPQDQGAYLNAVLVLTTSLEPPLLLARLQAIEAALGRDRRREPVRWGPREVDLDLLFMGDRVLTTADLVVPHPRAHERGFVMTPLAEVAPGLVHPVLGTRVGDLAGSLLDASEVRRVPSPAGWPASVVPD